MSIDDLFETHVRKLQDAFARDLLPAGTVTAFTTAARTLGIPPQRMLDVIKAVTHRPSSVQHVCHRIVPGDGWFRAGHPQWIIDRLRAEGIRITKFATGRMRIENFSDYWADGGGAIVEHISDPTNRPKARPAPARPDPSRSKPAGQPSRPPARRTRQIDPSKVAPPITDNAGIDDVPWA